MMPSTAFLFPGQGSQHPKMLARIPANEDLARLLDAADALAGMRVSDIGSQPSVQDMADTRVAQPLLYLADWAWGVALIESGAEPTALAGHSLGEIAALAVAGVFSVEAGLELVIERSRLMATTALSTPGTMAAVLGLDASAIATQIDGIDDVWIANDNAPGQTVLSGTPRGVEAATALLTSAGARRIVPLNVAGAFHCPLMEPAGTRFAEILAETDFSNAWLPVYQNTAPSATTDAELIRRRLMGQIVSPVRWTETMRALVADGITVAVEAGPGSVLTGLAKRVDGLTAISAEACGIEAVLQEVG